MPMHACPQCEAPLQPEAPLCDHCGFPLPKDRESHAGTAAARAVAQEGTAVLVRASSVGDSEPTQKPSAVPEMPPPFRASDMASVPPVALGKTATGPTARQVETELPSWENYRDSYVEPDPKSESGPPPPSAASPQSGAPVTWTPAWVDGYVWKLVVIEGFTVGKQYLVFKDVLVLGRRDEEGGFFPDIDLEEQDDGYISRRHAVLRQQGEQLLVEDLGGENGTFVQNLRLQPHVPTPVHSDQVIRLGRVGLLVKAISRSGGEGRR